jgi:hypothetical protein
MPTPPQHNRILDLSRIHAATRFADSEGGEET